MQSSSSGEQAIQPPTDAAQFTAWLVDALGRPLMLVVLRRAGGDAEMLAGWRAQLAAYPAVRLLVGEAGDEPISDALARIATRDPDALLVYEDAGDDSGWRAAVLDAAEGLNLFERMLLAWCGAGVTRAAARAAGYEDGFAPKQPLPDALATIAREAVARETYRRHGSSPPCYL